MEQRPKEWNETELQAHAYLRDVTAIPSAPSLTGYSLRFRLWHYPAFEAHRSWSVFESHRRREASKFIIRQVTWDRAHDAQRLHDPLMGLQEGFHSYPKIEVRDRPLDAADLAARLAKVQGVAIPIVGRNSGICLDGAMFGYEERDGSPRLEWCCDGPAEWRGFTTWANETMAWLHEICAVS